MTRIPPVRRLLMDAKALIAKPENWLVRAEARDSHGVKISVYDPSACKFCADGSIRHAAGYHDHGIELTKCARGVVANILGRSLVCFNDAPTTTHPMIMRLFNKAIKRAKEQGI